MCNFHQEPSSLALRGMRVSAVLFKVICGRIFVYVSTPVSLSD